MISALVLAAGLASAPHHAAAQPADDTIGEAMLPGGIEAARSILRDRTTASRTLFLAEFIRRFYDTPRDSDENQQPLLHAVLSHLDRASRDPSAPSDVVPLPLGGEWWSRHVFGGRVPPGALVLEILKSRDAAMLYCGLLQLDGPTRRWLGAERTLLDRLVHGGGALLVAGGRGLRVDDGRVVVPGGDPLRPAWEDLVGARTTDPAAFIGRVLGADDGLLAYFLGRAALVPAADLDGVLAGAGAGGNRTKALKRLYDVFRRASERWKVTARPFSSVPDDPVLLVTDMQAEITRGARVIGSDAFWTAVFEAHGDPSAIGDLDDRDEPPAGVLRLVEQVVHSPDVDGRVRAAQVRFALRTLGRATSGTSRDRAVTLAALVTYPAVVRTLERMGVVAPEAYRAAVERAQALRSIADDAVQARSAAEYQGALALLARAVVRGSVPRDRAADLVSSLAAVEPAESGEYGDGVARWVEAHLATLHPSPTGLVDDDLLALLSALPSLAPAAVDWEGTRYRVDLAHGDARRVERVRGVRPPRLFAGAGAIFGLAARIEREPITRETARRDAAALDTALADAVPPGDEGGLPAWVKDDVAVRALGSAARGMRVARRLVVAALRSLAEDLVARGLAELAYAAALGGSDRLPLSSWEAASRHDFAIVRPGEPRGAVAWRLPVTSVRARGPWHIEGALLGLDIALAETWLRRTSDRPLDAPPTVDRGDRRALTEVVVTMDPAALDADDLGRIAGAIEAGRLRVREASSAAEVEHLVSAVPVGEVRRSLLPWMLAHEPERFRAAFSPSELLRIGAPALVDGAALDGWGAPVRPRQGCVCLEFPRRPLELYTGFLSSGVLTGAVPDLNLRLAERLHELRMPPALLPGVLGAATLTLVDRAPSRYPDDLRAIVEQVNRVTIDDAEQYVSLLTVDGPLVPEQAGAGHGSGGDRR